MRVISTGIEFYKELEEEVRFHCKHHLQLIASAGAFAVLFEILNQLIKERKSMELIFYPNSDNRISIEETDCLLRLANQGAVIHRMDIERQEFPLAILDKNLLLVPTVLDSSEPKKVLDQYKKIFRSNALLASPFLPNELDIEIDFWSDTDLIGENEKTNLNWSVKNGDQVKIEPGIGKVGLEGSLAVNIKDDMVYTLEAKNKKGVVTRNIFLKYEPREILKFEVSLYEKELERFIPIQSPDGLEGHYAIPYGYRVRIKWAGGVDGRLSSPQLGNLTSSGYHEFEMYQDRYFDFHKRDLFGKSSKSLKLYVVDKTIEMANDEGETRTHLIFNLWKAIIEMVSTKI